MRRSLLFALFLAVLGAAFMSRVEAQQACFGPTCPGGGSDTGGITSGAAGTGCTAYSIVSIDSAGNLACTPNPVVNGSVSTAGRSILTISDTITGASATSNFLNVTGSFPTTLSAETAAILVSITGDNDAQIQSGVKATISAATTSNAYAVYGSSAAASTNTAGVRGDSTGAASRGVGVWGTSSSTGAQGGFFSIGGGAPQTASYALGADNGSAASDIFKAMDNGTAVFTIADGGIATSTNGIVLNTIAGVYYGGLTNGYAAIQHSTALTPDSTEFLIGSDGNSAHFAERADSAYDFNNGACGTAACTDPGLIIHSAVQDTTQYNHLANWGQAGGALKTLTESAATAVVRIPVAALEGTGGKLTYRVKAADATDVQIREGEIRFAIVNKAGTETCTLSGASEAADGSVVAASVGTLTYGITCDTTPANAVDLSFNAVSSLTQTTLNIQYFVTLTGVGQPARQ